MDNVQEQVERAVGDQFAEWLTAVSGDLCDFQRRGADPPDLIYTFRGKELPIEVTTAYYDDDHSKLLWMSARGKPNAPSSYRGSDMDAKLLKRIAAIIEQKAAKNYDAEVVLLIYVLPPLTEVEELAQALTDHPPSSTEVFAGVYVVGRFPMTSASAGGEQVIPIKELAALTNGTR